VLAQAVTVRALSPFTERVRARSAPPRSEADELSPPIDVPQLVARLLPSLLLSADTVVHPSTPSKQSRAADSTWTAPTTPPIAFFWSTADDTNKQVPQCAGFQVNTTFNPSVGVTPVLPLYFTAAAVGYEVSLGGFSFRHFFTSTSSVLTITSSSAA
jgi:hypothetical protein